MQLRNGAMLFSASDLVNFMGCAHATALDLRQLVAPVALHPENEQTVLLQQKGLEHERAYLASLVAEGKSVIEIVGDDDIVLKSERTRAALRQGTDVIYQGAFLEGLWQGYSDFLLKVPRPSILGDYSYEVADSKLSRSAKPKHLIQMCIYSDILAREQGVAPERMHVALGDGTTATVRVDAVIHYFQFARERFLEFTAAPPETKGAPCGHCSFCRWATACEEEWEADDHLSIVAGLTRGQAEALRAAGVADLNALAALPPGAAIDGMQSETLWRLREQARLQAHQRRTGERKVELLALGPARGLARLPQPSAGDMFFDMEGDPLFEGGLEYLFGIITVDDGEERFHKFWAHDREEERDAFQRAVDFMVARLERFADAHIYHYAAYEETALKRLAMLHGTREREVDDFLRSHRLVDLYRVVREAIRTSEPTYSIKNMEKFYLGEARGGEVTTAGDSIVMYEHWRRTRDDHLLATIGEYNRVDCASTLKCRDWLVGMRAPGAPWNTPAAEDIGDSDQRSEAEQAVGEMAVALLADGQGEGNWRRLLVDLLEFHRRESKPAWWAVFSRQDLPHLELLEDAECLAGLEPHPDMPPRAEKRSTIHTFTFPAQDFKLKVGDSPVARVPLNRQGR